MREKKSKKVLFPIGLQLNLLFGALLLISLLLVSFLTTYFVSQDVRITAENNNLSTNARVSSAVSNELQSVKLGVLQFFNQDLNQTNSKNAFAAWAVFF
ncbi:MAG: hypothetical protein IKI31_01940 [Treponema sp.]|nr:hypothetical protein [Treponema sp.]